MIGGREDGGELFYQMWPVTGFFKLFDDSSHDVVVDAISVDFPIVYCAR